MVKGFGKKVYFIGIGGISMSALARLLKKEGHEVLGSDRTLSEVTMRLEKEGVKVYNSHKAGNIKGVNTLVYTSAISDTNPELKAARESAGSVQVLTRAEALKLICEGYNKVIAISGSHGKTTTTAITSEVVFNIKENMAAHIGGEVINLKDNLVIKGEKKDIFITEACEYKDNFLQLKPDIGVILNIGADHLDYFKSEENVVKSFLKFAKNINSGGTLIINYDCKNCQEVIKSLGKDVNIITFSLNSPRADFYLEHVEEAGVGYKFKINGINDEYKINIGGEHNLYNALVSVIIAKNLGGDDKKLVAALGNFKGVARRFQEVGEINGAKVILDYAHHPDEIEKVIIQARKITKGKVFVLFQPHTYTRTKALWGEFIKALKQADNILLYPIYPAREKTIRGVTSKRMAYDIRRLKRTCYYSDSLECHKEYLSYFIAKDDILLVLGAGDIAKFKNFFNYCE